MKILLCFISLGALFSLNTAFGAPQLLQTISLDAKYTTDLQIAQKFDSIAFVAQSRPFQVSAVNIRTGKHVWKETVEKFIPLFVRDAVDAATVISAGYHELRENGPDVPIAIIDKVSGKTIKQINTDFQAFRTLSVSKDGRMIAGGGGKFIYTDEGPKDRFAVWDGTTGTKYFEAQVNGALYDLSFSNDGRIVISVDNYKTKYWDVGSQQLIKEIDSRFQVSGGSAFSSSLTYFASNGFFFIKLWDAEAGRELRTLTPGLATKMVFSPNNSQLAVGYGDGTIRLWKTKSEGEAVEIKSESTSAVSSMAFAIDGKLLMSTGSTDQTLKVWALD